MNKSLMRRILCFLLVLAMLVTMLPLTVFAEELGDIIPENPADTETEPDVQPPSEEEEIDLSQAVEVATAEGLEAELARGTEIIRIVADFSVDRTFYVTADTIIFTEERHTLTRAADFGSDIFVVGEDKDGVRAEDGATLTLGSPISTEPDMLIIDGNAGNMSVNVVGSAIFVVKGSHANLYHGLVIQNCQKVGNERVHDHSVSYHGRTGGAVAILTDKSSMNIYGGSYLNNTTNDIVDDSVEEGMVSSYGGAFYNYGTMTVYGGLFKNNHAARGGAFYNYRKMYIHAATIRNNTASTLGGAIYVPASTVAFTYIGEESDIVEPEVLFEGNSANGAGAIYMNNVGSIKNTTFRANKSVASSGFGGALQVRSAELKIENCSFVENTSLKSHGGAIYVTGSNGNEEELELDITSTEFIGNSANSSGGVIYASGECRVHISGGKLEGNSATKGGAIFATNSTVYLNGTAINSNSATNAGAIFATAGVVDVNGGSIDSNSATSYGGAIVSSGESVVRLNKVEASRNTTGSSGAFIYIEGAHAEVYNSTISNGVAKTHGGAIYVAENATTSLYATKFVANSAGSNGGALATYPEAKVDTLVHSCTFENNTASNYGGAIWSSAQTQIQIYNATATNNSAKYGGFFYLTTAGSVGRIVGLTISGNTDEMGGNIIWGNTLNAKLYIDKLKYIDKDYNGDWNDAYWASAIYNKLTVYEITGEVPAYEDYGTGELIQPAPPITAADVSTPAQLERALEVGYTSIRITADFEIDRTFFIKASTTIFTTKGVRLTRAADFGGDIFVVGRDAKGKAHSGVVLTLGKEDDASSDMLVIDGNKANMTVDVVGTVIYVAKGATVNLYDNVTITNCHKVGNERVTDGEVSYPDMTGGAVAIITSGSYMNIYGGKYIANSANEDTSSGSVGYYGGAFYNYGTTIIYDGLFEGNRAGRGGAFYNYRKLYIFGGTIKGNFASTFGGAIYVPNSTAAFTYIGEDKDGNLGEVLFEGNSANGGGAIYAQHHLSVKNTTFLRNTSTDLGGAIQGAKIELRIANSTFDSNSALSHGGAIYLSTTNGKDGVYDLSVHASTFVGNSTDEYGGAIYMYSKIEGYIHDTDFTSNNAARGAAVYMTGATLEINESRATSNTTTGNGGALAVYSGSYLLANNVVATGNYSGAIGGFAYVQASTFDLYNSSIENNEAKTHGGALAVYYSTENNTYLTNANVYNTVFKGNKSGSNGGAVAIYPRNDSLTTLHSCTFDSNTAGNYGGAVWVSGPGHASLYNTTAKNNDAGTGGFAYITTAGTVATIVGLTVSGNTDDNGAPIIWGNTLNAKLYIDKAKYTDLDHTGAYNSTYWKSAIKNKLTTTEITEEIPKYLDYGNESYEHMADAVDVATIEELEAAILSGAKHIRVVADITVDRTLYITGDVTIFSTIGRTLTRAQDFGGDIFVVGESADGVSSLLTGTNAKLTLGNPLSVLKDLLVFDGNRDNMTVTVVGTVLFVTQSARIELYDNVTMINHLKLGNERVLDEKYFCSGPNRVGGALGIIESGSLNIYGGDYSYNSVRTEEVVDANDPLDAGRASTNGGAFINYSNLNIYGGTFYGNEATRGAVVYNYRTARLVGGEFVGNRATKTGGVAIMPNTSQAHLYVGSYNGEYGEVVFRENSSGDHGGVIYISALSSALVYGNASFVDNSSEGSGGAICAYGSLTVRSAEFIGNTAHSRGGAIYASNNAAESVTRYTEITDTLFEGNSATLGGALALYASSLDYPEGAIARISGSTFIGNAASLEAGGASSASGGAIHADRKVSLWIGNSTLDGNTAATEGGAIYLASLSEAVIENSTIKNNTSSKYGGAIVVRASSLTIENSTVSANSATNNGGAIYSSYIGSIDQNSFITIVGSVFSENTSGSNGGAIYFTRHDVEERGDHLTVKDTDFTANKAAAGGAITLMYGVKAYLKNVDFEGNAANMKEDSGDAGAILLNGAILEMDGGSFTSNSANKTAGAISAESGAEVVLNAITASKNSAGGSAGFIYAEDSSVEIYNSVISENSAQTNGGGIHYNNNSSGGIYNTTLIANTAGDNGAAIMLYTSGKTVTIHTVRLEGNTAGKLGAVYVSNKSIVDAYNLTGVGNTADKGGFLYITTTGTVFTLVGATVSGNTATTGGPIIWGNSTGAKLMINKALFNDLDYSGSLGDDYWAGAIVNSLTVSTVTTKAPSCKDYTPRKETVTTKPSKAEVSVDDVFNLAEGKVSDGYINSNYNKLPVLDNSSNFMSVGTSTYNNINGGTVTVDNFIYQYKAAAGNGTVGEGLLIYQAMLYKRANPNVDVSISLSAYRLSIEAAVNINRNSRYFGYMRNLVGKEYDEFGFVRLSYLLVSAAKMGINVTVIGQLDGYPISSADPNLDEYFTAHRDTPCDSNYVTGTVGDYMNYQFSYWTLIDKGGTDMMHTKLCAVSHYLDMNGVEHKNAVFTSSSNLDGITSAGYNGNYKLQTSTIISDHEDIYRISKNYLDLVADYSAQEAIYEWQEIMRAKNKEQIDLILAGRQDEIPLDERIVYIGSERDSVFEMYFTPFGGDTAVWDTAYQPYAKYITEMYNSEGPITFIYNVAEHSSAFAFGAQFDKMIVEAFHKNKNPENKFYINMENFDKSSMSDLVVGVDIGVLSMNKWELNMVHNKDILLSYVKDGVRHYVSLLNSCNFHSGSMSYQSNFMLVINETEYSEQGVYFTMADHTTKGVVDHTCGEEKIFLPDDITLEGYTYRECIYCGKQIITGTVHRPGEWITDKEAEVGSNGLKHKECTACGTVIEAAETVVPPRGLSGSYESINGATFSPLTSSLISTGVSGRVMTIEAVIQIARGINGRGGVIVGNYSYDGDNLMNLEVAAGGKIRLYYRVGGIGYSYIFSEDIRGTEAVHIALTVADGMATLYINGRASETLSIYNSIPENMTGFVVGGDNRNGNDQYFKGRMFSVSMFSDARSEGEVISDMIAVPADTDALLYTRGYETMVAKTNSVVSGGVDFSTSAPISAGVLSAAPYTIEAIVSVGSGGAIISAFGENALSLEAYKSLVRLSYTVGGVEYSANIAAELPSGLPVHIALTISGGEALLYVNGAICGAAAVSAALPDELGELKIGAGTDGARFGGRVYALALFSVAREAAAIARDAVLLPTTANGLIYSAYLRCEGEGEATSGATFAPDSSIEIGALGSAPHTIEAVVRVPENMNDRVGVIVGNYDGISGAQVNFEIYDGGRPRLYIKNGDQAVWCVFYVDIRGEEPVHLAITVAGTQATLYINGEKHSTREIAAAIPEGADNFVVGGDNRVANAQYFKGEIYSVQLFSDVRSEKEVMADFLGVETKCDGLLYTKLLKAYERDNVEEYRPSAIVHTNGAILAHGAYGKPLTIEALISLSKDLEGRGGILLGNYTGANEDQINIEIYTDGRVRLFYINGGVRMDCIFSADVRRGEPTHIAIAVNGLTASLYINGVHSEDKQLALELPSIHNSLIIGSDYRYNSSVHFKGEIYAINIFSDVRSAEEIAADVRAVSPDTDNLVYALAYGDRVCDAMSEGGEHIESDWIIDIPEGDGHVGVKHIECVECGKLLLVEEIMTPPAAEKVIYDSESSLKLDSSSDALAVGSFGAAPKTFEFVLGLDKSVAGRAGVVFGNYDGGSGNAINIEIYTDGMPRFYYKTGYVGYSVYFNADIRKDGATHMAITIDGDVAKLYLDGVLVDTQTMTVVPPEVSEGFVLGSDRRPASDYYFKGEIYAVNIFSDVRSAEEIALDAIKVISGADNLVYTYYSHLVED